MQEYNHHESCWETFFGQFLSNQYVWIDLDKNGVRDSATDSNGDGCPDILYNYVATSGPTTVHNGPWICYDFSNCEPLL